MHMEVRGQPHVEMLASIEAGSLVYLCKGAGEFQVILLPLHPPLQECWDYRCATVSGSTQALGI